VDRFCLNCEKTRENRAWRLGGLAAWQLGETWNIWQIWQFRCPKFSFQGLLEKIQCIDSIEVIEKTWNAGNLSDNQRDHV
jgi:hypothetical protein